MPEEWGPGDLFREPQELKEKFPKEWEEYIRLLRLEPGSGEYKELQEEIERNISFSRESQRAVFSAWRAFESTLSPAEKSWYEEAVRSVVFVEPSRFASEAEDVIFHGGRYFPLDFEDIIAHLPERTHISLFAATGPWNAVGTALFESESDYLAYELEAKGVSPDRITCHAIAKNTPEEVDEACRRISRGKFTIIAQRLHARRVIQTYRKKGIAPEACFSPRQSSPLTSQDIARSLMEMRRLQVYADRGDIAPLPFEEQRRLEAAFLRLEERGGGVLEALHRECSSKN